MDFANRIKGSYVFLLTAIVAVALAFYFFADVVTYVLVSFILSLIGQPIMYLFLDKLKLRKFRYGPQVSAVLTLIIFILLLLLILATIVPIMIQQAISIGEVNIQSIAIALEAPLAEFIDRMERYGLTVIEKSPSEIIEHNLNQLGGPADIGSYLTSLVGVATNIFIATFAILFITFFFLQDQGMFVSFILALVPDEYVDQVKNVLGDTTYLLRRYFAGILVQISIITLYLTILLSLFGVQNALLIAFFAAVINLIPYIGPIIGAIFGVFLTISANVDMEFYTEMMPLIIKILIIFASMQLLDNMVLQPYIFSTSVLAHPLEIFLVIIIAGKMGGIVGMILAIPSYTVIRVIALNFLSEFKIVKKMTYRIEENSARQH
ncbi:MAG: AI-2E family transporter [Saprospirales bacterium]|nr:MAG: AI-2E family transporter [Saprospirales bacterium]